MIWYTPGYVDIGIAVSAPKGLGVPVIRNAEINQFSDIELRVREFASKAKGKQDRR